MGEKERETSMSKEEKYMWVFKNVDDWYKQQAQELSKKMGYRIPPKVISKMIHEKVILPNNIQATDLIRLPVRRISKKKLRSFL